MTGLRISSTLELPLDAVTQTFGILARRGAGKTYTGKVMAEEMIRHDLPVVCVDPIGVWWGLRSGYRVAILGGAHGDVPINDRAGAEVAQFVVENPAPMVLDLSGLDTKGQHIRFMTDFAQTLYSLKRHDTSPLHLMVDEVDEFAPQRSFPEGARLLGAMEALVRRGRARGLGCTLISQRPAVVNKNVLTQVECMIVMQMTGPQDRKAIDDWIQGNADQQDAPRVVQSLASLKTGEAWVWSPSWLEICRLVKIRTATTFDSSATPKAGEARKAVALTEVDLTALNDRMAKAIEEARDNDPKELKRRIKELEKQIAQSATETVTETIEVWPDWLEEWLIAGRHEAGIAEVHAGAMRVSFEARLKDVRGRPVSRTVKPTEIARKSVEPQFRAPRQHDTASGNSDAIQLPKAARALLTVLAQQGACSKKKLSLLSGYRGGHFDNTVGYLRGAGLAEPGWPLRITDVGLTELGDYDETPRTSDELFDWWMNAPKVGKAHRVILQALRDHGGGMTKRELQAETGYGGGHFDNTIGQLRTMELISKGWPVRLAEELL